MIRIHHHGTIPHPTAKVVVVDGADGVELNYAATVVMLNHVQTEADAREAGGVLVGQLTTSGTLIITRASSPGGLDLRERNFLHRLDPCHQHFVDYMFAKDPCSNFVGDWHTHPESVPRPSWTDLEGWVGSTQDQINGRIGIVWRFAYIIVGTTHLGVWEVIL